MGEDLQSLLPISETRECLSTGVPTIDSLVGCVPRPAIIDFYGNPQLVKLLSYHVAAWWHCREPVGLGIVHDRPVSYDLYFIRNLLRLMRCDEEGFLVARAFRLEDVLEMLEEAEEKGVRNLILYSPYTFSPPKPEDYWRLTPLTGRIRRLYNKGLSIALFNTVSKFGVLLPEGGKMHHHQTHVIVKLEISGERSYRATLIKHYMGRRGFLRGPLKELVMVGSSWGEHYPLSEWF